MRITRFSIAILAFVLILSALPFLVHAQGEDELHATIRAAIMSDPRSSSMSEAEVNALVDELAAGAEKEGVTANDISWRPQSPDSFNAANYGTSPCGFFCKVNEAFGITGSAPLIAVTLGIVAAILLFVIGMLLHHRGHHVTGKYPTAGA